MQWRPRIAPQRGLRGSGDQSRAEALPSSLAATLVYFTPAFFLISLFGSAHWRFDYWAILLGAALAPVAGALAPRFDLLIAGLVGGTVAFFLARPGDR